MTKVILLLAGGAVGTGLRYLIAVLLSSGTKQPSFPYATLFVNISGSFLIGLLAELFEARLPVSQTTRVAVMTGVLGGYTTFSSFSIETYWLLRDGQLWLAVLYSSASVLLGIGAVWLGMRLAQAL